MAVETIWVRPLGREPFKIYRDKARPPGPPLHAFDGRGSPTLQVESVNEALTLTGIRIPGSLTLTAGGVGLELARAHQRGDLVRLEVGELVLCPDPWGGVDWQGDYLAPSEWVKRICALVMG